MAPLNVPIEGYYSETKELKEYFQLMRALQKQKRSRAAQVEQMPEFRRLMEVTGSEIFGRPKFDRCLLPTARDSLTQALDESFPDWTVDQLVSAAFQAALRDDDVSLVGLAARAQDPIVMAATRESAVLYKEVFMYGLYEESLLAWQVDGWLEAAANRFIDTFNQFVSDSLPRAEAANAWLFSKAYEDNDFIGRCVRIAKTPNEQRHYHWAVSLRQMNDHYELILDDF